jgi:hypothetical protein
LWAEPGSAIEHAAVDHPLTRPKPVHDRPTEPFERASRFLPREPNRKRRKLENLRLPAAYDLE